MDPITQLILLTAIAGAAIPVGGLIASIEHIQPQWLEDEFRHTVMAFGGGALISAVALALIPDGTSMITTWEVIVAFALGGLFFWGLQVLLDRSQSSASQLTAMLSDFIPEVIALGAVIASGKKGAVLLALIIALQNVPEGFNSYREFQRNGIPKKRILLWFTIAAMLGPLLGVFGYQIIAEQTRILGWMQVFAAAGILYLVFEDIAPQVTLKNSRFPSLGALLGFLLGLIGKLLES
ncbi:ZIP family metal transporter [Thalassoglobus polymorphus]|uniref:Zinc transporter ZupT n=1 Tax=Thalassoglobus polymorphus TaxID=2527994 RepID=A0A517QT35_9PLAN|nr:divalent cation transporter [Thalassoglobus polymorphus]QDT34752.1 zinc transporter ZupT [Thalassoglobus polymorphus]